MRDNASQVYYRLRAWVCGRARLSLRRPATPHCSLCVHATRATRNTAPETVACIDLRKVRNQATHRRDTTVDAQTSARTRLARRDIAGHARHRRPAQRRAQTIFRRDAIASRGRGEHLLWIHTLSPPPDFGLSALSTSCDVYVTAFRTACERPSDLGEQRFSQGHGRCLLRFQQQLHIMQRVHEAGETLRA